MDGILRLMRKDTFINDIWVTGTLEYVRSID